MRIFTKPIPPAERKRMVRERCARSAGWRITHALGSLQLALVLLATIALACAFATFAESGFSTKVAQAYIYKAPWFILWLGVLCVNLIAVTITRWPWERKHLGFIVTHYGIVVLLTGAMIGLHAGFEGNVTLRKDAPPTTRVTTSRSIVQVESPTDGGLYTMPFDAELAKPSESRPRVFRVPGTNFDIVADAAVLSLVRKARVVAAAGPEARPAVSLRLASAPLAQEASVVLGGGGETSKDFFGMAEIRLHDELPALPPAEGVETRMVFAHFEAVSEAGAGAFPVTVRLSADGSRVSVFGADGSGATYLREEAMGKPLAESGAVVVVQDYWPDFEMRDGRPASRGAEPRNPAVLVRISAARGSPNPVLDLAVAPGGVAYRLLRHGVPYAEGTAPVGGTFALGWADWVAGVEAAEVRGAVVEEVVPGEAAEGTATPGFRARLESPGRGDGPRRWVESGRITSLTDGRNVVRIGYGLETRPLPFSIRLVNFEVPRDEGTDSPADFRATVEFQDHRTGATKTGVARMNRPASFPGTLAANLTGINYKFSQAEWNPRNLDETTLQVLYDPGWLLKWVGSLGICVGIALQFYGRPRGSSSTAARPASQIQETALTP